MSNISLETARDKFRIYRAASAAEVSAELLEALDWPETVSSILFSFDSAGADDCERLTSSLGEKYLGRFLYAAEAGELAVIRNDSGISVPGYRFRDHKELQDLYLRTEMECFGKKWAKYFPGTTYTDAIGHNACERLSQARIFCVGQNGTPVSLLPLTRIKHFLDGGDTDWVLWVWVEAMLPPGTRRAVHAGMADWLRRTVDRRVMTGVHVFNTRSNKFFQKLGFSRKWLQVTKISK